MRSKGPDWYKTAWSLDIKNMSWVEETGRQVDFIIQTLGLAGSERILDLACGYGRHALSFVRKGFHVVGVDITKAFIEDAVSNAQGLPNAEFICSDIRDVRFENEFDVVLNLADGAIGYLENDAENLKVFDVISRALRPGGKHFMDVCNADHAAACFPKRTWAIGENSFSFSEFEWDAEKRIILYGGGEFAYGEVAQRPALLEGDPIRLYTVEELGSIFRQRGMRIVETFSDYTGKPASCRELQLMVYSVKD